MSARQFQPDEAGGDRVIHVPVVIVEDDDAAHITSSKSSNDGPVVGQWYWLKNKNYGRKDSEGEPAEWLVCAVKVGSNFVEVKWPRRNGGWSVRVHIENFWTELRHEPNADREIQKRIAHHQKETARLMGEVQALTQRLGLARQGSISNTGVQGASTSGSGSELAVLSGQQDLKAYGKQLVKAKEKTLPDLHKEIKKSVEWMATWMTAPTLPLEAAQEELKESLSDIDGRILSVSLYAGLAEQCVMIADGKTAELAEKLHVMQRMKFMDEECLLGYEAGGMEFKDIGAFDKWLVQPKNLDRILPFQRTLVAMRVRREKKEREEGGLQSIFINIAHAINDKATFLYIRNGEQVHRLDTEIDFGEMIFPDRTLYDPQEPKMVKMEGYHKCDVMMTVSEYEERATEHKVAAKAFKAWAKAHPGVRDWDNPHRNAYHHGFRPDEWKPVDQSNVYFDECMARIDEKVTEFNRIALIIQGIFDRSMVLHPHLPVQSWSREGFDRAIKLVMDGTDVLHHGEPPDFEAYRARCNATLTTGSMTTGQRDFWMSKEAEKENDRRARLGQRGSEYRVKRYEPHGNPGPAIVARVVKASARSKTAQFSWTRESARPWRYDARAEGHPCNLSVPHSELLNVDAYQKGDYLQFYVDPRTRAQYLKWAPLMLAAEDYLASKESPIKNDKK